MKTRRWLLWFCVVFGCGRVFAVVLPEAAVIDGSDVLKITPHEAIWTHRYWGFPGNVRLNDVSWNVCQTNVLANSGTNRFLPIGVD